MRAAAAADRPRISRESALPRSATGARLLDGDRGAAPCRPTAARGTPVRAGAAAAHGHVRRSRGLDAALAAARSRAAAGCHARLPGHGRGRDRPLRRSSRQVHGRRGPGLFRLAACARGRGRAGGACGARHRRRPWAGSRLPAGERAGRARRHRHRARRGRRSDRRGCRPGAGCRGRDAEPGGAAAGAGRAGRRWWSPRARGAGGRQFDCRAAGAVLQGLRRAGRGLAGASAPRQVEGRFEARHGGELPPMVGREQRAGSCCSQRWRAGQGAARARPCCCSARPASASRGWRGRCSSRAVASSTAAGALPVLAASHREHAVASGREAGLAAMLDARRRSIPARRPGGSAEREPAGEADETAPAGIRRRSGPAWRH